MVDEFGGMTFTEARAERKLIKQKLFTIRRAVEGEAILLIEDSDDAET